jgi:diguanylate cyclase
LFRSRAEAAPYPAGAAPSGHHRSLAAARSDNRDMAVPQGPEPLLPPTSPTAHACLRLVLAVGVLCLSGLLGAAQAGPVDGAGGGDPLPRSVGDGTAQLSAPDSDESDGAHQHRMRQPAPAIPAPIPVAAPPTSPAPATAPALATLADQVAPMALWPHLRVWPSDDHVRNPDELLDHLDRFTPVDAPTNNLGRLGHAVWLHAAVQVAADSDGRWLLVLNHAPLEDARIVVYEDGRRIAQHRLGSFQPYAERPLPTRAHAAPLELRAGTRVDVLMRVSTRGATIVPLAFEKPATLLRAESRAQILHGIYLGLTFAMFAYSLALAVATRDRVALACTVLLGGSVGFFVVDTGLGQQYLWEQQADGLAGKLGAAFALLIAAGAASFLRHALVTRKTLPIVDGMLRALSIVALAGLATAPFESVAQEDLKQLAAIVAPLVVAVGLPAVWRAQRRGTLGASWLLAGWICWLVGTAVTASVLQGWLAANALTLNLFQVTNLLQTAAWTHALALRARGLRRRSETAAAERHPLERLARTDALTGLPNRRGLSLALQQALETRTDEDPTLLAVYLLDLDRFKPVNDEHGHETGDVLLAQVAQRLASMMRAGDVVARLGGDEFVVVASALSDNADAHALGHKLMSAFRDPFDAGGIECRVGASIGYAIAPEHGEGGVQLMRCADVAMVEGKQAGGGHLVRHDMHTQPFEHDTEPGFDVQVQRIETTDELRRALEPEPSTV